MDGNEIADRHFAVKGLQGRSSVTSQNSRCSKVAAAWRKKRYDVATLIHVTVSQLSYDLSRALPRNDHIISCKMLQDASCQRSLFTRSSRLQFCPLVRAFMCARLLCWGFLHFHAPCLLPLIHSRCARLASILAVNSRGSLLKGGLWLSSLPRRVAPKFTYPSGYDFLVV